MYQNTQTEQFWHPVMGAVDLITREIMSKKEQARQERIQKEEWERQDKAEQYRGMMDIHKGMLQDPNLDPTQRGNVLKGMSELVKEGPSAPLQTPQQPQPLLFNVPPDVEKAFPGFLKPGQSLTWDQAMAAINAFKDLEYKRSTAEARKTGKTSTVRHISERIPSKLDMEKQDWKETSDYWKYMRDTAKEKAKTARALLTKDPYNTEAKDMLTEAEAQYNEADTHLKNEFSKENPENLISGMSSFPETQEKVRATADSTQAFEGSVQQLLDEIRNLNKDFKKEYK